MSLTQLRYRLKPGSYRAVVGGMWEEIGRLQRDYLISQGLEPAHRMLDVGCGSMRGGRYFVEYLETGNYYGLDINRDLLSAGRRELAKAGLDGREPHLIVDDAFSFERFGQTFDYAWALSVFTHLPFNPIMRCLAEVEKVLKPGGRFYATIYENPGPRLNLAPRKTPKGAPATIDADPFYYEPDMLRWAVEGSSLSFEPIGDWGHPRNQQMMCFVKT